MKLARAYPAVCLTPACQQLGAEYYKHLHPNHASLDPCTNFDELVCGGWIDTHQLRPDQGQASTMSVMDETIEAKLRAILEGPYPGESSHSHFSPRNLEQRTALSLDQENFNRMQRAYNACMDEPAISALGVRPIVEILDGLQPQFEPLTGQGDLSWIAEYAKHNGIGWVLSVSPETDPANPDRHIVTLFPKLHIGLPSRSYYWDEDIMAEYRSVLTHVLSRVHPTGADGSRAAEWADMILNFETKLAEIMPEFSTMRRAGVGRVGILRKCSFLHSIWQFRMEAQNK